MSTTTTIIERRVLNDRRSMKDRRDAGDRRKVLIIRKAEHAGKRGKFGLIFNVFSSIIVVCIGLAIYVGTGLYDAAESNVLKIGMGVVIPYYLLVTFHAGLKVDDREN